MSRSIIESSFEAVKPWLNGRIVVAFSGGIDSTALLHTMVSLKNSQRINQLEAIHINHGLSDNALDWEQHCQTLCDHWAVPLKVVRVQVSEIGGEGVEQAARSARYQVFSDELKAGECLVQGHHLNDQAETLMFRLFRGTGVEGLSGIPRSRPLGEATLVRPLLSISRSEIERYVSGHDLPHIEDESNHDQHFSRNYLRHSLLPAVEKRWPGASVRLAALADEMVVVNAQLADTIAELTRLVLQARPEWLLGDKPLLDILKLKEYKTDTQKQIIRFWLKSQGLPVPGRELLDKLLTEVIDARVDASPLFCWPGCYIRRFQGLLIASCPQPDRQSVSGIYWDWQQQSELFHPALGCLQVKKGDQCGMKTIDLPGAELEIRTRETIDPSLRLSVNGRQGRKSLKRWLQEFNVPPWLRNQIPFLFFKGDMVAAPGVWVCNDYLASDGRGYQIVWSDTLPLVGTGDCTPL